MKDNGSYWYSLSSAALVPQLTQVMEATYTLMYEEEDEGRKKGEVVIRHFGRHRCNSIRKRYLAFLYTMLLYILLISVNRLYFFGLVVDLKNWSEK